MTGASRRENIRATEPGENPSFGAWSTKDKLPLSPCAWHEGVRGWLSLMAPATPLLCQWGWGPSKEGHGCNHAGLCCPQKVLWG